MSIIQQLNKAFRIDASNKASNEKDVKRLMQFASIEVPIDYLEVIRERTEIEIYVKDERYIRIWGASWCIEMNKAHDFQKYIPYSLAIGDDEGENAFIYTNGKKGFGIYAVAFNNFELDDMIYISKSLTELLILGIGVETVADL